MTLWSEMTRLQRQVGSATRSIFSGMIHTAKTRRGFSETKWRGFPEMASGVPNESSSCPHSAINMKSAGDGQYRLCVWKGLLQRLEESQK